MTQTTELERVIGGMIKRYKLDKKYSLWVMLCPFHVESKPSFTYNSKSDKYYCVTCKAEGGWADLMAVKEKFL